MLFGGEAYFLTILILILLAFIICILGWELAILVFGCVWLVVMEHY